MGCGGDDEAPGPVRVTPAPAGQPWETLGEWHLFANDKTQAPAERVEPYEVIAPLYSDETLKHRFVHLPEGATIGYESTGLWRFPVGTILVKTFAYPIDARDPSLGERLLETRLLVHEPSAWTAHTYVWNDAQTDAVRKPTGTTINASWIDASGATRDNAYGVPNTNQCQDCHGEADKLDTLGGRTRQLDRDGQIEKLAALGWFEAEPEPAASRQRLVDPFGSEPLLDRARSYLDSNCAVCHAQGAGAAQSGLWLDWEHTLATGNPADWGVCKAPTSAGGATCGLTFDVVPGQPDQSILICRIESREPKVQMPPLGTKIADQRGVALLREWIQSMTPTGCPGL
jgi:uncharacterized repeat protein (TIGR03806 family)